MPDLNQRQPQLATYLVQNAIWWIEAFGLSGIRADTYPYSDKAFLARWSGAIMAEYPNLSIVGEEMTEHASMVAYWLEGHRNHDGYVSHMPSMMDFRRTARCGRHTEPEGQVTVSARACMKRWSKTSSTPRRKSGCCSRATTTPTVSSLRSARTRR
jgi:glycosidase